jgi:hypothetical protein
MKFSRKLKLYDKKMQKTGRPFRQRPQQNSKKLFANFSFFFA